VRRAVCVRHWEDIRCWAYANGCLSFCPFLFKCLVQDLDGHWSCVYFSVFSQGVASLATVPRSRAMSCVVTVVKSVFRRAEQINRPNMSYTYRVS